MVAEAQKTGNPAAIARAQADAAEFARSYARPLRRMAITATEIAPVGGIVSALVAALLSRRRTRALPG